MISIDILEDNDRVKPDDYCRPLEQAVSFGDYFETRSCYGGSPVNNFKWTRVDRIYGDCWFGKMVKEINKQTGNYRKPPMEFARGDIPDKHILEEDDF